MRRIIPKSNWTTALADAIRDASSGDVIVVHTETMLELATRAAHRTKGTFHGLTFVIESSDV
jgi:tRNA A37 threonylcarbamoyladenosine synthetase subunit TsaC/SUA5/YrdC